ncbi:TPA: hypothetical protein EYP66_10855 [Candidatus Poribacteria bacterium]|nr:hypothetical protein [Candidatus Poribacteria bacterium]
MKFINPLCVLVALSMLFGWTVGAWASKKDCGDPPNVPPKPAKEVKKEDPNVQNDYDEVIEEDTRRGVTYLTFINGDQPKPNKCGLNPSNDAAEWTGWGGPLDADNMTIGEGGGTRNDIVIGGVLFERGIGTHALATIVYPLTGDSWIAFEGYVGMADEKDPAECGHGGSCDFTFSVDGKEVFKSDVLKGTDGGKNVEAVKVEFDIPAGAKELTIEIGDGGDGIGCDHGAIGDAKLLTRQAFSVNYKGKLTTSWGAIKALY